MSIPTHALVLRAALHLEVAQSVVGEVPKDLLSQSLPGLARELR